MRQFRNLTGLTLLCGAALILIVLSPQIPGVVSACSPKVGRVIDATTGEGLSDVFVLASASFEAGPIVHGSANRVKYNIVVRTDSTGTYELPSFWSKFAFGLPGTSPMMRWSVTAFRPGYVVVGDDDGWRFDEKGEAFFPAKSASETPKAHWLGALMLVEPLALHTAKLSLREATVYYRKILLVGVGQLGIQDSNEVDLRRAAHEFFKPLVCSSDPTLGVDMRTARYLMMFSIREQLSEGRLRAIDPARWASLSYSNTLPYSAAEVCEAMQAGD